MLQNWGICCQGQIGCSPLNHKIIGKERNKEIVDFISICSKLSRGARAPLEFIRYAHDPLEFVSYVDHH